VTLSDTTTISVVTTITVSDLAEGDTIMVRGETADGTVTATSITEGATGFGGGGFPGGGAPGRPDQSGGATGSGSASN
jgi:hypothetical protein